MLLLLPTPLLLGVMLVDVSRVVPASVAPVPAPPVLRVGDFDVGSFEP